jgi:hypothetical protein
VQNYRLRWSIVPEKSHCEKRYRSDPKMIAAADQRRRDRIARGVAGMCKGIARFKIPSDERKGTAMNSFVAMHARCSNPSNKKYVGVKVCARWRSFENFLADLGNRPTGTTLGRIGDVGNYEPGNARWMTADEQGHERSIKSVVKRLQAFTKPERERIGLKWRR